MLAFLLFKRRVFALVFRQVAYQSSYRNFYSVLGVQKNATQRQIKSAYYELSKKYHPDVAGNNESAKAKFVEINEAWECLKDPNRRNAYDNQMSGGGGRYPGDNTNPFKDFQQRGSQYEFRYGSNPFHNRQFTEQEYRRIWEEFNRLRRERESYDSRMNWQRQRNFDEYARRRAERWKQFHERYPEGPPGSVRWEWKWSSGSGSPSAGFELFRKMVALYMVLFFFVTILRIIMLDSDERKEMKRKVREQEEQQKSDRQKIEQMMVTPEKLAGPSAPQPFSYMDNSPIDSPKSNVDPLNEFEMYRETKT